MLGFWLFVCVWAGTEGHKLCTELGLPRAFKITGSLTVETQEANKARVQPTVYNFTAYHQWAPGTDANVTMFLQVPGGYSGNYYYTVTNATFIHLPHLTSMNSAEPLEAKRLGFYGYDIHYSGYKPRKICNAKFYFPFYNYCELLEQPDLFEEHYPTGVCGSGPINLESTLRYSGTTITLCETQVGKMFVPTKIVVQIPVDTTSSYYPGSGPEPGRSTDQTFPVGLLEASDVHTMVLEVDTFEELKHLSEGQFDGPVFMDHCK
eukprot:TRINITY_DN87282_c0_g1_i1.p1 TRINITY_DN87282_c0_g1~~TRINITY_DN87282_c0_g1_i1.p1  ORF type:complete len:263 (+),score=33.98 TRINITY_DN87282_c0_g1_i1:24-812(+)